MIQITHILCPIDFSEFSQHALDQAVAVARWYEARLTVLHVFVNRPNMDLPPLPLGNPERDRLTKEVQEFAASVSPEVSLVMRLREGSSVHEEILAEATESHADLIVLGSHGRSGFEHLFLGSVTEKVMRKAPCPTLVVPRRAAGVAADGAGRPPRILCPVDFSESSLDTVAYALNMAEEVDARLTLLHVVEAPEFREIPIFAERNLAEAQEAARAGAVRRLQELIPDEARTYCSVEAVVVEGTAYREILRQAAERHADLIVMGARGRRALDLLLFGSTTHHVIRAATCPVLVAGRG
jgi:nucleotide-binding universal stress UspA family protein